MKRFIQSHRRQVAVPREAYASNATLCEHPSLDELQSCVICEGRGTLFDPQQRRRLHAEQMPWDHPARNSRTWVAGYDR
jgi:hypothetical protein